MTLNSTYNTSPVLAQLRSGNVGADVFGDSLIAGQPSASGQGWDNIYLAMQRSWSLGNLRGFSTDLWRDAIQYTPTPDHSGSVADTADQKKPNGTNTWSPSATDEGVLGMLNGTEVAGLSTQTAALLSVVWSGSTLAAMAGYSTLPVVKSAQLSLSAITHNHTDGAAGQLQLIPGSGTIAGSTINTATGAGITKSSLAATDSSASSSVTARWRQRTGEGDQSSNYARFGQWILVAGDITGVTLTGCGIGGTDIQDLTNEIGDSPAGLCSDAALSAYQTVTGATVAIVMVGRNDSGTAKATLQTQYEAYFDRLAAAGYTHIMTIGNYWDQAMTEAQTVDLNEAMQDACREHNAGSGAVASNVSLYRLGGQARVAADLLEDSTHLTQAGADAQWALVQGAMDDRGGGGGKHAWLARHPARRRRKVASNAD